MSATRRTKWVVVEASGRNVGFVVDGVTEVFGAGGPEEERSVPVLGSGDDVRGIAAVYRREDGLVFVIDIDWSRRPLRRSTLRRCVRPWRNRVNGRDEMSSMNEVIRALDDEDSETRREAVGVLERLDVDGLSELLMRGLGDVDWRVRKEAARVAAVRTVAEMGSDPSPIYDALVKATIQGDNVGLRNAALEVFGRVGPAAATGLLSVLPKVPTEAVKFIIEGLGHTGASSSVPALRDASKSDDANIAAAALDALARIGGPQAQDALKERAPRDESVPAIRRARRIGPARSRGGVARSAAATRRFVAPKSGASRARTNRQRGGIGTTPSCAERTLDGSGAGGGHVHSRALPSFARRGRARQDPVGRARLGFASKASRAARGRGKPTRAPGRFSAACMGPRCRVASWCFCGLRQRGS